jgi:murein L,D-transpeptidase YcbB/YkuD
VTARILYRGALLGAAAALVCGTANASDAVADALRARIEQLRAVPEVSVNGAPIASRSLIPEFYERRGLRPAWTRPEQQRELLDLIEASTAHGLDPDDYHAPALRRLREKPIPAHAANVADRELLFTDALIRLAYHLHFGKASPRELYPGWSFTRSLGAIDPPEALEAMLAAPRLTAAVERFAPQLPAYRDLRRALARLRSIDARGGWPKVLPGPPLKPGERHVRVAVLRERLAASGDLAPDAGTDATLFDTVLEAAVRRFQARHGIETDGVIGERTLQALNVSVAGRIDQVRVNLERLRWVARDLAGDYLIVDIAGFTARLFLEGRPVWSSRTVVGRPYRKTPVFRADLRYLVLNPTWSVPPTILRQDILPRLARDPGYLARNHMQVVDAAGRPVDATRLDWARFRAGGSPYQIVQAPGDDNALGKIKFMLPNPHAVYLHDTPAKRLFERHDRAFSSGCIRLERPLELAALLLDDAERWNAQAIRGAIATGETRTLPVKRQVPVLILYFTAEAEEEGSLRFRPDLYGRDAHVLAALRAPFRFAPVDRPRAR